MDTNDDELTDIASCKRVLSANILMRVRELAGDPAMPEEKVRTLLRKRFGIKTGNAARVMDPTTNVGVGTVAKVARALGLKLTDLLDDRGTPSAAGVEPANVYGLPPNIDRRRYGTEELIHTIDAVLGHTPDLVFDSARDILKKYIDGRASPEQAVAVLNRLIGPSAPPQKARGNGA